VRAWNISPSLDVWFLKHVRALREHAREADRGRLPVLVPHLGDLGDHEVGEDLGPESKDA
jgi:hypothetical protein